jgi:hypothetical protein
MADQPCRVVVVTYKPRRKISAPKTALAMMACHSSGGSFLSPRMMQIESVTRMNAVSTNQTDTMCFLNPLQNSHEPE